jgi:hypothetical protein
MTVDAERVASQRTASQRRTVHTLYDFAEALEFRRESGGM